MLAAAKARRRLVTIRLTEAEYMNVRQVCADEVYRSTSDYVREAILEFSQSRREPTGFIDGDLTTLCSRLKQIDAALADVSGLIRRLLGSDEKSARGATTSS